MNQYGLIIQRTTSGLNDMFVSDDLKEIRKTTEIESSTEDENRYATKLANQSDVYTVQTTINYRVYSLVITKATDSFGRAGFYAIRLYTPKRQPLMNFEVILQEINKKYLEYEKNGVTKNNQNYISLLSYSLPLVVKQQDYITYKIYDGAFYLFDPYNSQLNNILNHTAIGLFSKVYAFNLENAVSADIIKSLGLKSFEETKQTLKEISIINNYHILKELKINNQNIDFDSNLSELTLICQSSDSIVFNTMDDKNFRQITNNFISIERKHVPRPVSPPYRGEAKKTFWKENGIYLGILLMIILIGGGIVYYFEGGNSSVNPRQNTISNTESNENPESNEPIIAFEIEVDNKDTIYKTDLNKLENYRFKFFNGKWQYKKENQPYLDFNIDVIKKIIKNNHLDVTENTFKKALEEKSGNIVEKKEIPKEETRIVEKTHSDIAKNKDTQKIATISNNKSNTTAAKTETEDEKQRRIMAEKAKD